MQKQMKTINTNIVAETIDAGKIVQRIEKDRQGQSILQQTNTIQQWIDDKNDLLSPVNFLGEEMFENYLWYAFLNRLDECIGNKQPFNLNQNYKQEVDQLFNSKSNLGSTFFNIDEVGVYGDENVRYYHELNSIDKKLKQSIGYNPSHDYLKEYNREFRERKSLNYFSDTYLKGMLGESGYSNFEAYKKLSDIDKNIGGCNVFNPSQNYDQQLQRQIKFQGLELLESDEQFRDFYFTIDYALQDRFSRKLKDNQSETKLLETEKLW